MKHFPLSFLNQKHFGANLPVCFLACLIASFTHVYTTQAAEILPEEIVVTERKPNWVLEREMREIQERAYEIYNELNDDDIYDIVCFWEAPLGTRIRYWKCRPQFFMNASADMAQAIVGGGAPEHYSADTEYYRHIPILDKKLGEIKAQSTAFREAISEYEELRAVLEAPNLRESE